VVAGHQRPRRPRLHLDEHQHVAVPRDEVDLVAPVRRTAPVARHDPEAALAAQPRRRGALAVGPGVAFPARSQSLEKIANHAFAGLRDDTHGRTAECHCGTRRRL
jgi:hypothetical protein